jgi:predicted ATPase
VTKEAIPVTSDTQRPFVVTGGPGSGKTTLIDALAQAGCARSIEAGRGVIQDQMAVGGPALPWRDPKAFAELMVLGDALLPSGAGAGGAGLLRPRGA